MFSPRQLLGFGVQMDELQGLRSEIIAQEGEDVGEAVVHLLAFAIDKLTNYNSAGSFWHAIRGTMANTFDRHDFSFKLTFAEMAPVSSSGGLAWAYGSVIQAYEQVAKLPGVVGSKAAVATQGSAASLIELSDRSVDVIVVDPPYSDNVQYSELADFFYVWLKRSQGHRRPEWFSSLLCENSEEAVKNVARFRGDAKKAGDAAKVAQVPLLRPL